ncbi:hypothetical protein Tcan_09067 [Toxocara canis]|uniref:Uncharacterized protein n=1 Tax=Toxocara canis TaxID=6265 RepID=A0A0B2VBB2_TOXCA|nr:hypothetical protein Tcan_09067 [Toxocara canis]
MSADKTMHRFGGTTIVTKPYRAQFLYTNKIRDKTHNWTLNGYHHTDLGMQPAVYSSVKQQFHIIPTSNEDELFPATAILGLPKSPQQNSFLSQDFRTVTAIVAYIIQKRLARCDAHRSVNMATTW